jgi:type I restriction enzyme S subunit
VSWDQGDAPDGWKLSRLGSVAQVTGGGTPKTGIPGNFSETEGHPWITPADLTSYTDKYITRGRRFLTDQGLTTSSAKYLPAGSVLFSTRAPIGYVAVAGNPVTTNQGFRSFVPNGEVDSEYLYYALKYLTPLAEQMASGTTFAELSGSKAADLPIAYPQLNEQRAIVRALDVATDKARTATSHLSAARRTLDRFRQAVLSAACAGRLTADWRSANPYEPTLRNRLADLPASGARTANKEQPVRLAAPELPTTYAVSTIREASLRLEYGTNERAETSVPNGIPVLRMGNIQDGRLNLTNLKFCRPEATAAHLLLEDGDLLFNRTNSPELVGKSAVFRSDQAMTFASYLIRVRFDPLVAEPDFVNYWLNSAWGRAWARQAKTDGVSQSNINGSKLAVMLLPLPPVQEQRVIVERASQMLQRADAVLTRINTASSQIERSAQSIVDKAFRGELSTRAA